MQRYNTILEGTGCPMTNTGQHIFETRPDELWCRQCALTVVPPFTVVPIDVNADGDGPETDSDKVAKTVWQVWDAAFIDVATYDDIVTADALKKKLNRLFPPPYSESGPDTRASGTAYEID